MRDQFQVTTSREVHTRRQDCINNLSDILTINIQRGCLGGTLLNWKGNMVREKVAIKRLRALAKKESKKAKHVHRLNTTAQKRKRDQDRSSQVHELEAVRSKALAAKATRFEDAAASA